MKKSTNAYVYLKLKLDFMNCVEYFFAYRSKRMKIHTSITLNF